MDKTYPCRVAAILAALVSAALLPGQVETARIIGTVRDQTGAVIAGARPSSPGSVPQACGAVI